MQALNVTDSDRTMRALRITGPRRLRLEEIPAPEPLPSQVRVRLEGCGLCGSNLAVWQGRPWLSYPLEPGAPGHEGWGTVDRVGLATEGIRPGDRVALLSFRAFAEYDVAEATHVVPLPPRSPVFPGEALGCAVNVFRRSELRPGQTVAVIGIGFLGALLVQLAARAGATVVAVSRRRFALEVARRCGAAAVLPLAGVAETAARVLEIVGPGGCERVIEAAGLQETLDLAGEVIAHGGRLAIAGYHQDGPRTVNMHLWNWRGIDVINAHERDPRRYVEGMAGAAAAVRRGEIDPSPLYTHGFGLEQTEAAFAALEERPEGFLKGWLYVSA